MIKELSMLPGVLPSIPFLLTRRVVLDIHAPPESASTTIPFVVGVRSVCSLNLITAIHRFVDRGKTGMIR